MDITELSCNHDEEAEEEEKKMIQKYHKFNGCEQSQFPILCQSCFCDNLYLRMVIADYKIECKVRTWFFTVFRWQPSRTERYKKPDICQTYSKLKNRCQVCLLDLEKGLPVQVSDTAFNITTHGKEKHFSATEEDINHKSTILENEKDQLRKLYLEDLRGQNLQRLAASDGLSMEKTKFQVESKHTTVLSLQITLFPDQGFSIGVAAHHGVLDGKMSTMFVKAWAHLCKQHLEETTVLFSLPETLTPSLDRSLIKDTTGLDEQMLNIVRSLKQGKLIGSRSLNSTPASERGDDVVFATLVLSRGDVERLRERVKNESPDPSQLHLSTFVISYAYMWTCLVKARGGDMERSVSFLFVGDFRERLDPPLPATYFGNCMFPAGSYDNTAAEFAGEGGFVAAVEILSGLVRATVLSLQITLFPGQGFSIGVAAHHAVLDGKTSTMFVKAWAHTCKRDNTVVAPLPETLTPSLDRSLIKDTTGLDEQMLKIVRALNDDGRIVGRRRNLSSIPAWERGDDGVFATLVLSRGDVERLRERVENESSSPSELLHLSTLVVAYAYVWTCLVKARGGDMERPVSFLFVADFRERLDPPLPATYFGNCMFPAGCFNSKTAGDFAGEGGFVSAVEILSGLVKGLSSRKIETIAEEFKIGFDCVGVTSHLGSLAGSTRRLKNTFKL
ncbi:unnamed protein product [Brassica napus]|uniref:(rape) hypothetical protein n=1 Tax=Brassica napus TaxID=3708 RepID=A0A816ZHU5_BRANA|nr:unnamed protein product [Brassica napus]